jgi:hypothetical protein
MGFGAERSFDSLDDAFEWANRDGGDVMLFVDDHRPDLKVGRLLLRDAWPRALSILRRTARP